MTNGYFTLEELHRVDTSKLADVEVAEIERAVAERETLVSDLQVELLTLRSERDAYQTQLETLEDERLALQERIRELEVDRPKLETGEVLANFGTAIEDVRREVEETGYTIGGVEIDLKANVVTSDEGVKLHLPSLDETVATNTLSDIRFRVDRRTPVAELEYEEIPDLRFRPREEAERLIDDAGFVVGSVEFAPGEEPGIVLEQFPSPFSVARPGAAVDLVIAEEPDEDDSEGEASEEVATEAERVIEESEVDGRASDSGENEGAADENRDSTDESSTEPTERDPSGTDADASSTADPDGAEPPSGSRVEEVDVRTAGRLREAGVLDADDLATANVETLADATGVSAARVERLKSEADALLRERATGTVDEIDGVGEGYASRLERAGVRSIDKLATKQPEEIAEATGTSPNRAATWIEQARSRRKRR